MADALDPEDFRWFCAFLRDESAIIIDSSKEYLVPTRLPPVLKEFGLASFKDLVVALKRRPMAAVHHRTIEAMTTNETSFFRDIHPFETLKNDILPDLVRKRSSAGLNIWCAASSTGQEPYTIAMILHDTYPDVAAKTRIFCTDINATVLARTAEGKYSQLEINRGLPANLLIKHFERHGTEWRAKEYLRKMMDTRVMNLATPWGVLPPFDVVFLRNVLIYFELETRKSIVRRVRQSMAMDGYLFLGGAETLLNVDADFTRTAAGKSTLYRRAA